MKCSTAEQGNQPLSGTKTIFAESKARTKDRGFAESKARTKDLSRMFCTPQKLEHLISKENKSNQSLNQRAPSFQSLDVECHETKALYDKLEADNVEDCRERENCPERIAANRSVLDLPTKNHSSFESATTTVDTPSGFTTDPDYLINGLRQFEPSLSSADSGQLQDISGVAGPSHPMVRYAPTSQWNYPRAAKKELLTVNGNISKFLYLYLFDGVAQGSNISFGQLVRVVIRLEVVFEVVKFVGGKKKQLVEKIIKQNEIKNFYSIGNFLCRENL